MAATYDITVAARGRSTHRADITRPSIHHRASITGRENWIKRELELREVDMVSGASPALITGGIGAVVGGVGSGVGYLLESSNPTASGFVGNVVVGTISGAFLGSGVKLVSMAFSGVRGVAVRGVTAIGVGLPAEATRGAVERSNGGSD